MLCGLANEHLDWRKAGIFRFALLYDSLDRVSQQLADDVLKVAEDVWECCIQVAVYLYLGNGNVGAISSLDQLLHCLSTVFDDFFGIASQEDLAYSFLVVWRMLGLREMPGRIEGLGECQMLFGDDPSRNALLLLAVIRILLWSGSLPISAWWS